MPLVLETPRLTLTQLSSEDEAEIAALYANPLLMQFIEAGGRTKERTAGILAGMRRQWDELGFGYLLARERGQARLVGAGMLMLRAEGRPIELGYLIDQPFWGKGYATEISARILRWGFEEHQAPRIIAEVTQDNHASVRVLCKLGFVLEGAGDKGADRYTLSRETFAALIKGFSRR